MRFIGFGFYGAAFGGQVAASRATCRVSETWIDTIYLGFRV